MAAADRLSPSSLIQRLLDDPAAFDFVQAVRLLDLAERTHGDERIEPRRSTGEDAHPDVEAVRYHAAPALRFPAAEIARAELAPEGGGPTTLVVNFLGLTGPTGVMPRHYTEHVVRNLRDRQSALSDFFDVFNHRLISLFYRASVKYRLPLVFERGRAGSEDPFSKVFEALLGLSTPHLKGRLPVEDQVLAYYSGHFARQPRSAAVLEQMLSDFFGQKVGVSQFRGQWLRMDRAEQTRLPGKDVPDGQHNILGQGAVVGERTWDMQGGFRISIGPLDYDAFANFMPGAAGYRQMVGLTRMFVGPGLDFDIQVTLGRDHVPYPRLGGNLAQGREARLGWNAWLRREVEPDHRREAIFPGNLD